jgi:hypothetical protein
MATAKKNTHWFVMICDRQAAMTLVFNLYPSELGFPGNPAIFCFLCDEYRNAVETTAIHVGRSEIYLVRFRCNS